MEIYFDGQPVGSIYLNGQFTGALVNAHTLCLTGLFSYNIHGGLDMDGVEVRSMGDLVGDAMQLDGGVVAAAEAKDVVNENDSSTWKCCPLHTILLKLSDVVCDDCHKVLHPNHSFIKEKI